MRKKLLLPSLILIQIYFTSGNIYSQNQTEWWNDATFYEVFVRSFFDNNNDGKGDINGLIKKLDYLNDGNPETKTDLGVNGIWLMPINQSPSYHGYDVTDFKSIENDYGTMNDFRRLIDSAHARGIKVIIDMVLNHTSSAHPWFTQSASGPSSPMRNRYRWSATKPAYTGSWGQQVWHYKNASYYFGMFWSEMPDLNWTDSTLKKEMFEMMDFWLTDVGVDGFRLDAIKHLFEDGSTMEHVPATFTFLKEFRNFYKGVKPDALTVGEVWNDTPISSRYVDGTMVDMVFDFQLATAIINSVRNNSPSSMITQMQNIVKSYPYLQYATFLTNHDHNRVFTELGQNMAQMKLAAALYLTLPGVPFIYYGEETAMTGSGDDMNKRRPLSWSAAKNAGFTTAYPWTAVDANYTTLNIEKMQSDSSSLWHWYRRLISARNQNEELRRGNYLSLSSSSNQLFSFLRVLPEAATVAVHNISYNTASGYSLSLNTSALKSGDYYVTDMLTDKSAGTLTVGEDGKFSLWKPGISIPAYGSLLLKLQSATSGAEDIAREEIFYRLEQNYPNPFNPSTRISYTIPAATNVALKVYNTLGDEIAVLEDGYREAGTHTVVFDGSSLSSGVYFYRLQAGSFTEVKRLMLIK